MSNDALPTPARLRGIRESYSLTQAQMGGRMGLNRNNYAHYERGTVCIDFKFTLALREVIRRLALEKAGLAVD